MLDLIHKKHLSIKKKKNSFNEFWLHSIRLNTLIDLSLKNIAFKKSFKTRHCFDTFNVQQNTLCGKLLKFKKW